MRVHQRTDHLPAVGSPPSTSGNPGLNVLVCGPLRTAPCRTCGTTQTRPHQAVRCPEPSQGPDPETQQGRRPDCRGCLLCGPRGPRCWPPTSEPGSGLTLNPRARDSPWGRLQGPRYLCGEKRGSCYNPTAPSSLGAPTGAKLWSRFVRDFLQWPGHLLVTSTPHPSPHALLGRHVRTGGCTEAWGHVPGPWWGARGPPVTTSLPSPAALGPMPSQPSGRRTGRSPPTLQMEREALRGGPQAPTQPQGGGCLLILFWVGDSWLEGAGTPPATFCSKGRGQPPPHSQLSTAKTAERRAQLCRAHRTATPAVPVINVARTTTERTPSNPSRHPRGQLGAVRLGPLKGRREAHSARKADPDKPQIGRDRPRTQRSDSGWRQRARRGELSEAARDATEPSSPVETGSLLF